MALTKEDVKIIQNMLTDQHSSLLTDVRTMLREELAPIKADIALLKQRVDQLYRMVNDDLSLAFKEIELLKKRIKKLETKVGSLKG